MLYIYSVHNVENWAPEIAHLDHFAHKFDITTLYWANTPNFKSVSFTIETILFLVTDLDMNLTKNKFELNTSASGEKVIFSFL